MIKEENKDDAVEKKEKDLDKKAKKEQAEEDRRKNGLFTGLGGLLKTIAMGQDGKGEKGLLKGGLLGFGKMGFGGIAATLNFLFKALKFIGGPLLLIGGLAFLTMSDEQQKALIDGIVNSANKLWDFIKYLGEAFKSGFMSGMDDKDGKEGLRTKIDNLGKAWNKAFASLDDIKFTYDGTTYTGLAGVAEAMGEILSSVAGVLIDFATEIGKFIADPSRWIGKVQGKIMALFDDLGALVADFWHEGIANPRTWRNMLISLLGPEAGAAAAASFGLGLGDVQEKEATKKQTLTDRQTAIDSLIEEYTKDLDDTTKKYSAEQRRFMASEIERLKSEKDRNDVKIKNIAFLHRMDNAEAELA